MYHSVNKGEDVNKNTSERYGQPTGTEAKQTTVENTSWGDIKKKTSWEREEREDEGENDTRNACGIENEKNAQMKMRMGGEQGNRVIEVRINKLQAKYSSDELKFFREAISTGHMSQTHFTDPGAICVEK